MTNESHNKIESYARETFDLMRQFLRDKSSQILEEYGETLDTYNFALNVIINLSNDFIISASDSRETCQSLIDHLTAILHQTKDKVFGGKP